MLFIFNIFLCTVCSLAFYFTYYLFPFLWNKLNDFVLCTLHLQQLSARNKPDLGWRCSKLKLSLCVAVYVSFKCTPCICLCLCVCECASRQACWMRLQKLFAVLFSEQFPLSSKTDILLCLRVKFAQLLGQMGGQTDRRTDSRTVR